MIYEISDLRDLEIIKYIYSHNQCTNTHLQRITGLHRTTISERLEKIKEIITMIPSKPVIIMPIEKKRKFVEELLKEKANRISKQIVGVPTLYPTNTGGDNETER